MITRITQDNGQTVTIHGDGTVTVVNNDNTGYLVTFGHDGATTSRLPGMAALPNGYTRYSQFPDAYTPG